MGRFALHGKILSHLSTQQAMLSQKPSNKHVSLYKGWEKACAYIRETPEVFFGVISQQGDGSKALQGCNLPIISDWAPS